MNGSYKYKTVRNLPNKCSWDTLGAEAAANLLPGPSLPGFSCKGCSQEDMLAP